MDIKDHILPVIRRKTDCVIIHCGTNDLTSKENIDTVLTIKEIITESKKSSPNTTLVWSKITTRKDREDLS